MKRKQAIIEYFEAKAEEKYLQKRDVLATIEDVLLARQDVVKAKVG